MSIGAAAGATLPLAPISMASVIDPGRPKTRGGPICLNRNENVYGPCKKAVAAMQSALTIANRYPDNHYDELTERIAKFHGVNPDHMLLGCGSTEILRVAAMAFLGGGKQLLQASPTLEAMEHYARSTGAEVVSVPLNGRFAHDLDAMLAHANTSTTLVYICNPNNPTASLTPRRDLENFIHNLHANCYALIDEAYHHYAGKSANYASFIDHPVCKGRIIVCRTFSKVYGLAGLRLGYCVAEPVTIEQMRTHITLGSLNSVGVDAASAALEDEESIREFVAQNADDRQEFFNQATARMLKPIDSHASFVMMNTYHPSGAVIEHFRKDGILVGGPFPAMDTHIRVSLGTPEEMRAFWISWDKLPFAGTMKHH